MTYFVIQPTKCFSTNNVGGNPCIDPCPKTNKISINQPNGLIRTMPFVCLSNSIAMPMVKYHLKFNKSPMLCTGAW